MENFFGIAGFIISIIAIWLTIYYSDRFGLRAKVYEKRLSVILELLEVIKGFDFNSHFKDKNEPYKFVGGFSTINFKRNFTDYYLLSKHLPVYFAANEFREIFRPLNQIHSSPYLPVEIVNALNFLNDTLVIVSNTEKFDKGVVLTIEYNYKGDLFSPQCFCDLDDYLEKMENVISEIKKWLNRKTKLDDDFNI